MAEEKRLGKLPRLGELIDRYRVVAEIAHGGMAAVYAVTRADAPGFDKLLAMKVMLPHLASDERFVEMFTDESRIAARINHPNVVQVFDVGQSPFPHLVLEFVHGRSLASLLKRAWEGPDPVLTRGLVCRVLADVADGLHAAHEARSVDGSPLSIVHRDVSPENVLIGYDGQVKIADFGVAAARGRIASTRTGEVKGKMAYMAPEQLTQRQVDRRTDLWSFGVMTWQIFARRELFRGASESETMWNVINRAVPDIEDLDPTTPSALAEFVHSCLQREAHLRPSNAADVARVLRSIADVEGDERSLDRIMADVFAAERDADRQRLAEAIRDYDQGPPVAATTTPTGLVGTELAPTTSAGPAGHMRRLWLIAAAIALVVSGVGALVLTGERPDEPTTPVPVAAIEAPPSVAEVPTTDEVLVTLRIGSGIETVLVDESLHVERPLRAPVGSTVTLVGADRVRRVPVGETDDGSLLVLEAPGTDAAPASRMGMTRRRAMMRPETVRADTDMSASDWMPLE